VLLPLVQKVLVFYKVWPRKAAEQASAAAVAAAGHESVELTEAGVPHEPAQLPKGVRAEMSSTGEGGFSGEGGSRSSLVGDRAILRRTLCRTFGRSPILDANWPILVAPRETPSRMTALDSRRSPNFESSCSTCWSFKLSISRN
jgi:hypothetical protein